MPFIEANGVSISYEVAGRAALSSCCCTNWAARCIPGTRSRRSLPSGSACCATTSAAQASPKRCARNSPTIRWWKTSKRCSRRPPSPRPTTSSPSLPPRRNRCGSSKGTPIRSVRSSFAIRRQASIRVAPPRSTSAPPSPCAKACARPPHDAQYFLSRDARRTRRLRDLSRSLSRQRSRRLRFRLPRAGAHQHAPHAAANPMPGHGRRRPPRHSAPACRKRRSREKNSRRKVRVDRGRPFHADARPRGAARRAGRFSPQVARMSAAICGTAAPDVASLIRATIEQVKATP